MAAGASIDGLFAVAFAGSASLAALLPLAGARAVPAVVRLGLALAVASLASAHAVAPLASAHVVHAPKAGDLLREALEAAALGGATGLGATIVAGAAASAGALMDGALGAPAIGADRIFGQGAGPFGVLAPLLFALAMTNSGALTWLIAGYAAASSSLAQHFAVATVGAVGQTLFAAALVIALPALFAHAVAALMAGVIARLTPRVNGTLLAPALQSMLVLAVVVAGASALMGSMIVLSRLAARAALL